jgi:hypothetical protein
LDAEFFFDLERRLKAAGLDSDSESFDVIKERLSHKEHLSANEFARQAIYVILAGGFSQKTAKVIHGKVMDYIEKNPSASHDQMFGDLIKTFNNKNKINAVIKIWQNRQQYRDDYYAINGSLEQKLAYIVKLPHIGKITANHLARNLGEDVVKYDIWIQRLGVVFSGRDLWDKIDNGDLDPQVKAACDEMFAHLARETGLPRGYIDVVLWKACQNHMIEGL